MIYKVEIEINLKRDDFLEKFQDIEILKQWQEGLESIDLIEGKKGEVGSKNILTYNNKGKVTELTETILKKDLPDRFDFLYEAKGVENVAVNFFFDKGDKTIWIAQHQFFFKGFMKVFYLFKGMFIKQTTKDMKRFKEIVENIS